MADSNALLPMLPKAFFVDDFVKKIDTEDFGTVRKKVSDEDNQSQQLVRVLWFPSGKITEVSPNQIELKDRFFELGQWIQKDSKIGQIRDVLTTARIKLIGNGEILDNVPTKNLLADELIASSRFILFQNWIGEIKQRNIRVWLQFDNGLIASLNQKSIQNFVHASFRSDYITYPGLKVTAPWPTLKDAQYENMTEEMLFSFGGGNMYTATVQKTKVISVDVNWLAEFPGCSGPKPKLTSVFENDSVSVDVPHYYHVKLGSIRGYRTDPDGPIMYAECISLKTTLQVQWEDDSTSEVLSTDAFFHHADSNSVLPYGYVKPRNKTSSLAPVPRKPVVAAPRPLPDALNSQGNKFSVKFFKFQALEAVPETHAYFSSPPATSGGRSIMAALSKDINFLQENLPAGIWVKNYENRMDLFSILIEGPEKTPYEDMAFVFEASLPSNYPNSPPLFKYISYTDDYCNPNLYQDGKVCVSILGTWPGNGVENWNPQTSNLLQVLTSIQGLILVSEPYYNEPGYERRRNTAKGLKYSRKYNLMVIMNMVSAAQKIFDKPPPPWEMEMKNIFGHRIPKLVARIKSWMDNSSKPEFPLLPIPPEYQENITSGLERLSKMHEDFVSEHS